MSTTTHAPKKIDPSASLHAESLGLAKSHGRLAGRRIIVVGAGQRKIVDEDPPIGNGRAMSVLFAREGATVACIDVNKDAADDTVKQITAEGGKAAWPRDRCRRVGDIGRRHDSVVYRRAGNEADRRRHDKTRGNSLAGAKAEPGKGNGEAGEHKGRIGPPGWCRTWPGRRRNALHCP